MSQHGSRPHKKYPRILGEQGVASRCLFPIGELIGPGELSGWDTELAWGRVNMVKMKLFFLPFQRNFLGFCGSGRYSPSAEIFTKLFFSIDSC
jgi:hypothetical protein